MHEMLTDNTVSVISVLTILTERGKHGILTSGFD